MPSNAQITGRLGEAVAESYIKDNGFLVLDKNYRVKNAEIDIIAKDNDTIAFIEVKTRKNIRKGSPAESVNYPKQKKIISAALYFIRENNIQNTRLRFDVIEVFDNNGSYEINLIKNAFQAS
ncbi:MAG: YraN family protein [Desulfobacteraceae bacterium]|nr:YraN family protein [Desulfobacteraceae bacterium]